MVEHSVTVPVAVTIMLLMNLITDALDQFTSVLMVMMAVSLSARVT